MSTESSTQSLLQCIESLTIRGEMEEEFCSLFTEIDADSQMAVMPAIASIAAENPDTVVPITDSIIHSLRHASNSNENIDLLRAESALEALEHVAIHEPDALQPTFFFNIIDSLHDVKHIKSCLTALTETILSVPEEDRDSERMASVLSDLAYAGTDRVPYGARSFDDSNALTWKLNAVEQVQFVALHCMWKFTSDDTTGAIKLLPVALEKLNSNKHALSEQAALTIVDIIKHQGEAVQEHTHHDVPDLLATIDKFMREAPENVADLVEYELIYVDRDKWEGSTQNE